jgi:hypothetical protein
MRKATPTWLAAAVALAVTGRALGVAPDRAAWPPFLAPPGAFPEDVARAVERVWADVTLERSVEGRRAAVPLEAYIAFVDTPEVTGAAAGFLRLARYQVTAVGDGVYRADDGDGAQGFYRVLVRQGTRRVILSWGEHTSRVLGRIQGSALSVLDLEPGPDGVRQRLTAHVRIDNAIAAFLARVLLPFFGGLVDRKLSEGFAVSAAVAEWAVAEPAAFCGWLARSGVAPGPRERVARAVGGCPEAPDAADGGVAGGQGRPAGVPARDGSPGPRA